ncbi:MAG: YvcK family protein [Oscillospiraceae bacterium]|nr:YvcK family protein [Oscillospiraceae bacterium]
MDLRGWKIPSDGGPRIAAIGGGTGLSTMLRGLKHFSRNITAIVTMADDGGSSGLLRKDLGMPPPGDLRNCIQALANVEPVMADLLNYRFHDGSLAGQSFGNLFLAALDGICPSFEDAVERMNQILAVTGRVLPVTDNNVEIVAELENGTSVRGESKIFAFKKQQHCRIRRIRMEPEHPAALPRALEAIREADVIILGPGSLYTSIVPNLLVDDVAQEIANSHALRIYVANIMTQEGETEEYTLSEHIQALYQHGVSHMIDVCLANSEPIPEEIQARYRLENAEPIVIDSRAVRSMGIEVICEPLAGDCSTMKARHDPEKLALAIINIIQSRCVRTWTERGVRYIREH